MEDAANAGIDRDRIPRRADTEAIDMTVGETLHHVRRRQDDKPHIVVGIDAAGRHPVAQLVIMMRKRKRHAEGQRLGVARFALSDDTRQGQRRHFRVSDIAIGQAGKRRIKARRHGDGVAIQPEIKGRNDRHPHMPNAEARCHGDRGQKMRGIEQADIELVAHIRP